MVTRSEKRQIVGDTNFFREFIRITKHFFPELIERLRKTKDHRHISYVTYLPEVILIQMIMKNILNLGTMRQMTERLNNDDCIANVAKIAGVELEELPHYDTINDFLSGLDLEELETIRTYMVRELLKKRSLEDFRIDGKYWGIILDGTGLYSFREKHCEHCLRRTHTDEKTGETTTIYMHHVLEAKLVVGDMVLSIGSEFIENESEDVSKQDCELKAFRRLCERIKKVYPRLPVCIMGDSLYACEGVFKLCDDYKWRYLIRFKEGRIKSIASEFGVLKPSRDEKGITWVNEISYNDRFVNLFEGTIEQADRSIRTYTFITSLYLTRKKSEHYLAVGRSRWKIENEGFNTQKNIRYYIEHVNSENYNAMKAHYLITQIADIIMQLYEKGCKVLKLVKKTVKEISSDLLEAIRTRRLTAEDIQSVNLMQIRLN